MLDVRHIGAALAFPVVRAQLARGALKREETRVMAGSLVFGARIAQACHQLDRHARKFP